MRIFKLVFVAIKYILLKIAVNHQWFLGQKVMKIRLKAQRFANKIRKCIKKQNEFNK